MFFVPLRKYYQGQHGWHTSPSEKVDPMYFVKILKIAKLTCMLVEDDIAKIITYVPVETGQSNRWTDMLLVLGNTEVRWT